MAIQYEGLVRKFDEAYLKMDYGTCKDILTNFEEQIKKEQKDLEYELECYAESGRGTMGGIYAVAPIDKAKEVLNDLTAKLRKDLND